MLTHLAQRVSPGIHTHRCKLSAENTEALSPTCSTGALVTQLAAPDWGAGGFGEFIGRHPVHHASYTAKSFVPPSRLQLLGFAA